MIPRSPSRVMGRTGRILIFDQSTPVQIRDANANVRCDFFFANPGATNS